MINEENNERKVSRFKRFLQTKREMKENRNFKANQSILRDKATLRFRKKAKKHTRFTSRRNRFLDIAYPS